MLSPIARARSDRELVPAVAESGLGLLEARGFAARHTRVRQSDGPEPGAMSIIDAADRSPLGVDCDVIVRRDFAGDARPEAPSLSRGPALWSA
jgi:hypothetical protein